MADCRGDADLAAVGGMLADRSRSRILLALADGRCLPASMLAAEAGVSSSTASSHLAKLTKAGLVTAQTRGRFRYYSLAGAQVGRLIEAVAAVAPAEEVRSLRAGTRAQAIRRGRTCYDHLAGRLGVAVTEMLNERGWVEGLDGAWEPGPARVAGAVDGIAAVLTTRGRRELMALGVELPKGDGVRCCLDWTEQRPHLAGAQGRALLDRFVALDWIRRAPRHRAVQLTATGRRSLCATLGNHPVFAEFP